MRNPALITAVLFIAVGGCAESIANSPECERWIADYSHKLAEAHPVIAEQKRHVKNYVHRTIGTVTKPKLVRTASPQDPLRPRLTPSQMLKRFQVLCGDLPPVETAMLIPPVAPPTAPATPALVPGITTPASPASTPGVIGSPILPGGGSPGIPTGGGTPPTTTPPITTPPVTTPPVTTPPTPPLPPDLPPTPPPDGPPVPPVPEPSTLVLMLAGTMLAAGYKFRRKLIAA